MPRAIWKGAITFGLVHVPVGLYPASQEDDIDFDWLDKRSLDPVGYQRVNKRTGKEIDKDDIVKGVKQGNGEYVVLSDDEVKQAYPKTTQTIQLEAFVKADGVSFVYFEKPYYLEPSGRGGEKVYALLREAMAQASVIGIGRIVMHTKEHLVALIAAGPALMLETIRWSREIRPPAELNLPGNGKVNPSGAELKMAGELIEGMTSQWKPEHYADKFTDAIHALVAKKAKAGKGRKVAPLEEAPSELEGSNVVDLSELLRKSLGHRRSGSGKAEAVGKSSTKRQLAHKRA